MDSIPLRLSAVIGSHRDFTTNSAISLMCLLLHHISPRKYTRSVFLKFFLSDLYAERNGGLRLPNRLQPHVLRNAFSSASLSSIKYLEEKSIFVYNFLFSDKIQDVVKVGIELTRYSLSLTIYLW